MYAVAICRALSDTNFNYERFEVDGGYQVALDVALALAADQDVCSVAVWKGEAMVKVLPIVF